MAKKTFEELVQLKQDKKIGWLDFVRLGDNAEEYARWCADHGTEPSEDTTALLEDKTEERV